ncbi:cholinesterase 1-like isoform X2 [Sitophilus oryzae]|uniref:Carboxylic ester hydrolase n=1 Tax=Sitophilus oryzae TaxID=7048 RepID=A0A6J2XN13_SITOR|nr:cholinesterase 1-like isoform X2 [Sitophilus oryzae]
MQCVTIIVIMKVFLTIFCIVKWTLAADLQITLPYGTIDGHELTSPGNVTFRAFQGIPYAATPVGTLRFQAPQAPASWDGVKETVKDSHTCFSVKNDSDEENEDCLYINVFTPILSIENVTKLAVMVWIYGGAYRTGSSKYNNFGPDFLIEKDVVVVTFNYRVGPFGFLATEDGLVPGNAGLKDQAFALQWVHDNINLFGGDPEKVVIFGQSAGGSSVGYQLLYKKNEGLFRGGILQSGSPLSTFSYMGDISARAYAFDLASQINNTIDFQNDTTVLLEFLLGVTGRQIDTASTKTTVTPRPLPVIEEEHDGAIITKESFELLAAGEFLKIPIMIGSTSEEDIVAATGADKVGHSEDTKYLWKVTSKSYQNGDLSQFPTGDVIAHKRLIELWTNFAKYLNPTPEQSDLLQNITWPKVAPGNFQYLDIGDDLVVLKNPKAPYYQSWSDYYDLYAKRPFTTF